MSMFFKKNQYFIGKKFAHKTSDRFFFIMICLLLFSNSALCADEHSIPYINEKVEIDGNLNEPCWQRSAKFTDFVRTYPLEKPPVTANPSTEVKVFWNDEFLFLGVVLNEPNMNGVKLNPKHKHDESIWNDDSFELYLDPGHNGKTFFQIIINSSGTVFDCLSIRKKLFMEWNMKGRIKTKKLKNKWIIEMKLPFSSLTTQPADLQEWGMNFTRVRYAKAAEYSTWSPVKIFNKAGSFNSIVFKNDITTPKDIKIRIHSLGNLIKIKGESLKNIFKFSCHNTSDNNKKLNIQILSESKDILAEDTIVVSPKENKQFKLAYLIDNNTGKNLQYVIKEKDQILLDINHGLLNELISKESEELLFDVPLTTKSLIINGSFESWERKRIWNKNRLMPSNWNPWTFLEEQGKRIEFSRERNDVKHGKYALKLTTHAKILNFGSPVSLISGKKYELSAYVKTEQKSKVILEFYISTTDGKEVLSLGDSYELEAGKWFQIKTIQTMPENIKTNNVYLMFRTKGTYLVDNIELQER